LQYNKDRLYVGYWWACPRPS